MHIPITPTTGNGPPITPKKRKTNDVANSCAPATPSRRVQSDCNTTELTQFQRAALALAEMSPTQYLNSQRGTGRSAPRELSVAEEPGVEVKDESDSADEVEFVRWLSPQEIAAEAELISLYKACSLNTPPVVHGSRSRTDTVSPTAVLSKKGTSKMPTAGLESPAPISPTARLHVPTGTSRPAVQSSHPDSQQLSVIPDAAVLHLLPGSLTQKKRYYVVTTGKCAGIYYDIWTRVKVLTDFVPSAKYHGYSTYREARNAYTLAKECGDIEIIRFPGDDAIFGPLSTAIQ